jgi:hypothetical protein
MQMLARAELRFDGIVMAEPARKRAAFEAVLVRLIPSDSKSYCASVRFQKACKGAQQRCLSRAVRSHDGDRLSGIDTKTQVAKDDTPTAP